MKNNTEPPTRRLKLTRRIDRILKRRKKAGWKFTTWYYDTDKPNLNGCILSAIIGSPASQCGLESNLAAKIIGITQLQAMALEAGFCQWKAFGSPAANAYPELYELGKEFAVKYPPSN